MPQKANRCPHCWAALADFVIDFCPFCRGSVAVKQKRRRRGGTPEVDTAIPPPVASDWYQPAGPTTWPAPASSERDRPYQPYEPNPGAPVQPGPGEYAMAAAPPAGGVAVAERDRTEFPGAPLPPDFFDALPERVRNPRPRRISVKAIAVLGVVAVGAISGISQATDRNEDISSPARHLVRAACAEYRDFTTRLDQGDDVAALEQAISWFQNNGDRFAEAARLDPELAGASEFVTWFDGVIEANFAPLSAMSEAEIDAREEPLVQACYSGPGRA